MSEGTSRQAIRKEQSVLTPRSLRPFISTPQKKERPKKKVLYRLTGDQ